VATAVARGCRGTPLALVFLDRQLDVVWLAE
jgi:hypothetical protein